MQVRAFFTDKITNKNEQSQDMNNSRTSKNENPGGKKTDRGTEVI